MSRNLSYDRSSQSNCTPKGDLNRQSNSRLEYASVTAPENNSLEYPSIGISRKSLQQTKKYNSG